MNFYHFLIGGKNVMNQDGWQIVEGHMEIFYTFLAEPFDIKSLQQIEVKDGKKQNVIENIENIFFKKRRD
jgi:hypothetical protein